MSTIPRQQNLILVRGYRRNQLDIQIADWMLKNRTISTSFSLY